jgi:hypothetical protein
MRISRYESPAARKILPEARRLERHCNALGFYPEAGQ